VCFPDYERYQSQLKSVIVDNGTSRTSHKYDANGILAASQNDAPKPGACCNTSGDDTANAMTILRLEFQASCLTLKGVDDGHRKGFLSLHDVQGARVGGVTQNQVDGAFDTKDSRRTQIKCTLALVGMSWSPIGFFSNIESFIGSTVEEKSMSNWMQDMLAPVNARYEQRFENVGPRQHSTRYKLYTPNKGSADAAPLWSARTSYYALLGIMPVLMAMLLVAFAAITVIGLALLFAALVFMLPLYGMYFAILRPFWVWSDFFRVAHVLWIEEVETGRYRRRGAGEVQYRSWLRLKPEVREIVLI
jgi:hypothetical protein